MDTLCTQCTILVECGFKQYKESVDGVEVSSLQVFFMPPEYLSKKFILLTLQAIYFQDIIRFSIRQGVFRYSRTNHAWRTLKDLESHSWERQFPHWQTARQRQRVHVEPWRDVKTWVHEERGSQKRAVMPHPRQYLPRVIIRCVPMGTLALPRYTHSLPESFLRKGFVLDKRDVMPHPRQYLLRVIIRCRPMWKLAFPGQYQTALYLCRADRITQQQH